MFAIVFAVCMLVVVRLWLRVCGCFFFCGCVFVTVHLFL